MVVPTEDMIEGAPLTVSELTRLVRESLETEFSRVIVEGEIANLKVPSSGHVYFTLKDESAQITAVLFRAAVRFLKFRPADGLKVVCRGRLTVYEPRGTYQVIVESMDPCGRGALQLAFEQVKGRLTAEGLFDEERKRPLPFLPIRVGVITSPTGAAIRDVLRVLRDRFADLQVLIHPVPVQGPAAARAVSRAIDEMNRHSLDVLLIVRGGGSLEDLWAFNEEEVVRAIVRSRVPVVTGIGHETDFTLADFASDLRAPTPTAAASMIVRSKIELHEKIDLLARRLARGARSVFQEQRSRLRIASRDLGDLAVLLERFAQRVDDLAGRLRAAWRERGNGQRRELEGAVRRLMRRHPEAGLARQRGRFETARRILAPSMRTGLGVRQQTLRRLSERLTALSPLGVLSRGYSLTFTLPEMAIVRSAAALSAGDRIRVRLGEGSVDATVDRCMDRKEKELKIGNLNWKRGDDKPDNIQERQIENWKL
ncbi:MAG: exodeoxyribonuclease VII large subunit [Nitrospirae bacterium RBG_16_64_22]|nr:MAG: exodeoxyribonuclease VII large subunit [Nitrospirae bacterium RBG_16_64_22]